MLLKELRKVKIPTRSFHWLTQIWMPTQWIVKRSFQGTTEVIPTVLSSTPTSITTPRSDPSQVRFTYRFTGTFDSSQSISTID